MQPYVLELVGYMLEWWEVSNFANLNDAFQSAFCTLRLKCWVYALLNSILIKCQVNVFSVSSISYTLTPGSNT